MKTDRFTVQMVVAFIGSACLLSIGGLIALSFIGRAAPEPLTTLAGAAIGALGSLLARTSTESTESAGASSADAATPAPGDEPVLAKTNVTTSTVVTASKGEDVAPSEASD